MRDLVERLRDPPLAERNEGIKIEAADEIERLRAALMHTQWSVITEAMERYSDGRQRSDLVTLGIVGQGVLILDEVRLAALGEPKP